jgi:hypothetical protein
MAVTEPWRNGKRQRCSWQGEACSGLGEGAGFTALEWVRREFLAKLGFEPYPGTFNLRMSGPDWEAARRVMAQEAGIPSRPEAGFCAAKCFHVVIAGCITGRGGVPRSGGLPVRQVRGDLRRAGAPGARPGRRRPRRRQRGLLRWTATASIAAPSWWN